MHPLGVVRAALGIGGIALLASAPAGLAQAPARPAAAKPAAAPAETTPGAGPIVVIETIKGTFEFETYPDDAPKTVAHVLALVKKGYYNGQRFHRAVPNFVVQVGDPQSRDMSRREWWGRGEFAGSGTPVGVAEFSKKHLHVKGAVAMAHSGNASQADGQFYVTLAAIPKLNGKYAVFGRVISGFEVLPRLQVADLLKKAYVKP
jgi:peptidyl-prolyl cis-trans isomerase B (cyclophilin B)